MPRAPSKRCTYKEGGRRCAFDGTGDPPVCDPHRVALAEAARIKPPARVLLDTLGDWLSGKPINREATIGAAEDFLSQWVGNIGGDYRPDMRSGESEDSVHRRAQPGARPWNWNIPHAAGGQQRQQQQPDPQRDLARARQAARQVMGFAPNEVLDEAKIKVRHRELVKANHPDRGGSTKRMAIINAARDVLVESLRS